MPANHPNKSNQPEPGRPSAFMVRALAERDQWLAMAQQLRKPLAKMVDNDMAEIALSDPLAVRLRAWAVAYVLRDLELHEIANDLDLYKAERELRK